MIVLSVEIRLRLFDSYSLKDKRSVVKSILKKLRNRFNVSTAEIGALEMQNEAVLGIATVGNEAKICEQVLRQCLNEIENNYEVEIYEIHLER